jgi:hypothetical protein
MDAFGLAERDKREALTPLHLFRNLGDRIFGPGGVLGSDFGGPPYRPQVVDIKLIWTMVEQVKSWHA